MILSKAQAEAVYSAMVALNNVSGNISVWIGENYSNGQHVEGSINGTGSFQVYQMVHGVAIKQESYEGQGAFRDAYRLE